MALPFDKRVPVSGDIGADEQHPNRRIKWKIQW